MKKGFLYFPRPDACDKRRLIRKMTPKPFGLEKNVRPVEKEEALL